MRLHILSEFQIEAFEAPHLAEFIVEDLILALQRRSSRIVTDDIVDEVKRESPHLIYHYDLGLTRHRVSAQFISEYLAKLGKQGVEGQEDICAVVRKDIEEIEQLVRQAEEAQERKKELIMLLENMGDTSYRRQRMTSDGTPDLDLEDHSEAAKSMQTQIVKLFHEHDALTNNEIRTKTGGHDRLVIRAIKRLGELNILDRDRSTKELKIVRGKEFDRAEELLAS